MCLFILVASAFAEDDPMVRLRDHTLKFFRPVTGKITALEDKKAAMDIGLKNDIISGMRLHVLSEGEPFIHPVTREVIGKIESVTGKVEVKEVQQDTSVGLLIEGNAKAGDRVRMSGSKVKVLFCQDKKIDWYLADDYYRKLKESGRIELIDTSLETDDVTLVLNEARRLGAEAALMVTSRAVDQGTLVLVKLFWVFDGSVFFEEEAKVDVEYAKELKFGADQFTPQAGEAVLLYNLPYTARFVATGDCDGDGKQEILLSNGRDLRVYVPGVDLQLLWEIKGKSSGDHLWIETIDLNKNGKDEIVISSLRSEEVFSNIYELDGSGFRELWEGKYFLRKMGTGLIAQGYSRSEGFSGDVVDLVWENDYRTGEQIRLPKGMNIYDFTFFEGTDHEKLVFGYDEAGFLNLYDAHGIRVWRSAADTGGFLSTFKKYTTSKVFDKGETTEMFDRGTWSVKDRLIPKNREILVVQRIPLAEMAKGIGFKSSRIKNYWWNGFSMDEGMLIDRIKGTLLDYALAGDKMLVLTSPFLGIKFDNILKGENPLGTVLSIYSVKGR